MIYNSQTHRSHSLSRFWGDFLIIGFFAFLIYGTIITAQRWTGELQPTPVIDLSVLKLPVYGIFSLFRAVIAYTCSMIFSIVIGYMAAKSKTMEQILIPLLDMGQSIPVLGFLPPLVLGALSFLNQTNMALELACILAIFTGQVWNLTFSFYSSIKNVPTNLHELSTNINLSAFQKFIKIELPFSASGLAWNSLMSMAGGWFFLNVCESFTLGGKDFRLPGLGSYMAVAIEKGDQLAMVAGFAAMVLLIASMDFIFWRPIISWTRRFRMDEQSETAQDIPFVQLLLQESRMVRFIEQFLKELAEKWRERSSGSNSNSQTNPHSYSQNQNNSDHFVRPISGSKKINKATNIFYRIYLNLSEWHFFSRVFIFLFSLGVIWVATRVFHWLEGLTQEQIISISLSALATLARIIFAVLISTLWTVPFGLWVGLSPNRTRIFQPIIQIAASFPAPMLYPIVLMILDKLNIPLSIGSIILILLGVQWYLLFNVLAGTTMISRELIETFSLIGLSKKDKWLNLYLPSIMPNLLTGWITAFGGAWNACIVAEYIKYKGEIISTTGMGSLITIATDKGEFSLLVGALIALTIIVSLINRVVWSKMYAWIERRFKFER